MIGKRTLLLLAVCSMTAGCELFWSPESLENGNPDASTDGSGFTDEASAIANDGGNDADDGDSACTGPSILDPTPNETVGPSVQLRTSAPVCITATKCYLDGNPTPVASAGAGGITQSVSVAMGGHSMECNGWVEGVPLRSATVAFTRTY